MSITTVSDMPVPHDPAAAAYASLDNGPVLIYDLAHVSRRIAALQSLQTPYNCRFLMAVKAFSDPRVLRFFMRHGIGFDLSNAGEWALLNQAREGADAAEISLTGPALAALLGELCSSDDGAGGSPITVNVDSASQLDALIALNCPVGICARITFLSRHDRDSSGGKAFSRFGVDADDPLLEHIVADPRFQGLHCHTGRKIASITEYCEIAQEMMAIVKRLGPAVRRINFGGGLRGFTPESMETLLQELRRIVPDTIMIYFEPGDYWFEGSGYAMGRVLESRSARGGALELITTDLSADCHLRWSEPEIVFQGAQQGEAVLLVVFGPTCHEGDLLGAFQGRRSVGAERVMAAGDTILFSNVSSYAASWNTSFNGISKARVMLHGENNS